MLQSGPVSFAVISMAFKEGAIRSQLAPGLQAMSQAGQLPQDAAAGCADALLTFLRQLDKWNRAYNLTAIRDPAAMVTVHVLDSLALHPLLIGARVLDVGTGAGLPGIPLALVNPDKHFVLLDSNGKKIRFVQHVIGELGLTNVTAVQARVEQWDAAEFFPTIVSRAFSSLGDFVASSGGLMAADGCLLAMKGKLPDSEIADLPADWGVNRVEQLRVPGLDAERCVVGLERNARSQ